ncbi:MAG TPA: DUF6134 family protein, partial [Candidatus Angelobacter sp.]|nr:DUF6134 family protein [Candidatus Angelobacter sp.]
MERTLTRLLSRLRQRRRSIHLWALAAPVVAAAMLAAAAAAEQPVPQDLDFKIVREGDDIGHHRITFRKDAEKLVVRSDLKIEVKMLAFTAYRYEQTRSEVWRDRKLVALASVANDDGTFYDIKGQAGPN